MKKTYFKLDNKGWGLQALLGFILVLMLFLIISSVLITKTFNGLLGNDIEIVDKNKPKPDKPTKPVKPENEPIKKTYNEMEHDVIEATKKYQKNNYTNVLDGEKITVTINNLIKEKLLDSIIDVKDDSKCSGYGEFKLKNGEFTYHAYLKCSHYTTEGYNEIFDIK